MCIDVKAEALIQKMVIGVSSIGLEKSHGLFALQRKGIEEYSLFDLGLCVDIAGAWLW
jgi:hypothetical protein